MERTDLVSAFRALFAVADGDHDGRISHAEWIAATPRTGARHSDADRASPIRMALRAPPEDVFRDLDHNRDGLITFEEFVRDPLASFDCLDADHDGTLEQAEREAGRTRCAAVQTPVPPVAP